MLRLKMVVNAVKSCADSNGDKSQEEVSMNVVYGADGSANKQWSKWTPNGQLNFTISNPDAFGKVKPGQFVFIDITETDKDGI
jgi:hypothetical protein